jgi:hypothetical protein
MYFRSLSDSYDGAIARNMRSKDPFFEVLSCKSSVRDFISSKVGERYCIPVIAKLSYAHELHECDLPSEFVIKPSHASGAAIIVKQDESTDVKADLKSSSLGITIVNTSDFNEYKESVINKLQYWLDSDYSYNPTKFPENVYSRLTPCLIVEPLLKLEGFAVPHDYKFHYLKGKLRFIQVDYDRISDHKRQFFTSNWERIHDSVIFSPGVEKLQRPHKLQEMIEVSSELSSDLEMVRIDFMVSQTNLYVSEISLFPDGGFGKFNRGAFKEFLR